MCTAATYSTKQHYFGRNLDLEYSYHEEVTITPRKFPFAFRKVPAMQTHYALIGMAFIAGGYPLYYDAANEKGLGMAGLNFPTNAYYGEPVTGADNIAPFEIVPWVLGQCADLEEAKALLSHTNLINENFSEQLPLSPLHWMLADTSGKSIVVESVKDGLKIYDNPVGVMTNNPTFDIQLFKLNDYRNLTPEQGENRFAQGLELAQYSRGMGAIGLPGDLSSSSRFAKVAFTRMNSLSDTTEEGSVSQFFHILGSVEQQRGCCRLGDKNEITIYSSCINLEEGIYYYRTYDNSQISAVSLHHTDLDADSLTHFELVKEQQVNYQN
ncbi:MAG: choloylglycine hydrolase [Lachnospira sp.]|nr:choloylglycine hydrolase [Lachnospira sp.]